VKEEEGRGRKVKDARKEGIYSYLHHTSPSRFDE
jgi:hypothetical protein